MPEPLAQSLNYSRNMTFAGIKLNLTTVIISIVVLVLLIALGWYFYRQGKKQVTLQSLPGELPGNPQSGNFTGASNDEIKAIANDMYNDMKGFNGLGHNMAPYDRAVLLNDADIVKLYNTFNAMYQKDSGETLTEWISSEQFYNGTNPYNIIQRLKKLNCF